MKYIKRIDEEFDIKSLDYFQEDDLKRFKSIDSNDEMIRSIKALANNYINVLLNVDYTDDVLANVLSEYIDLLQLIFVSNDKNLDYHKILSEDRYFNKHPFRIERGNKFYKCLTDLNNENVQEKDENLKELVYTLTKNEKSEKDLTRLKKRLRNLLDRKTYRKFLSENKKSNIDDVYDTLYVIYFILRTKYNFVSFLKGENLSNYIKTDTDKKDLKSDKEDKKSKEEIEKDKSFIRKITNKFKGDVPKNIPKNIQKYGKALGVGLGLGAVSSALSTKDKNYVNKLHKSVQPRFAELIKKIEELGYRVVLTSGYRSFGEQLALKKKNKSNASAGSSPHNYGLALDMNIVDSKGIWYKKATSKNKWLKTGVPQLANKLGFRWGGNFKSYHDPVHFDVIDNKKYNVKKMYASAKETTPNVEDIKGNLVQLT